MTSFHHQPEAQHPKSSAIHKLGRPITPSVTPIADIGKHGHLAYYTKGPLDDCPIIPVIGTNMSDGTQSARKHMTASNYLIV